MVHKVFMGILLILYPAIVYYGLTNGLAWFGLLFLTLFFIYKSLFVKKKRWYSIATVCILSLGALLQQAIVIKLIPIAVHLGLFFIFYQSLREENSLIEKFARLDFPDFPDGMAKYCFQITQVWVLFFTFNIVLNIILILWASDRVWAMYNGILVYFLIAFLVIGEYVWRQIKFPDLLMPSFKDTAIKILKNSREIIGKAND
ncbi:MAG: hypothetical protein R8L53_08445 [Mariprofundales bacterium]